MKPTHLKKILAFVFAVVAVYVGAAINDTRYSVKANEVVETKMYSSSIDATTETLDKIAPVEPTILQIDLNESGANLDMTVVSEQQSHSSITPVETKSVEVVDLKFIEPDNSEEFVEIVIEEEIVFDTADDELKFYTDLQYSEYPVACQVWQMMRSKGWSEPVCAGILGNMMTECGGLTLNLVYNIYDPTWRFYGLCQWSLYWVPSINGLDVEQQMEHLFNTIEVNMKYFGGDFNEFLQITDPGYAALYFQWFYEIGSSSETRYAGALEAYEYFKTK